MVLAFDGWVDFNKVERVIGEECTARDEVYDYEQSKKASDRKVIRKRIDQLMACTRGARN